MKRWPHGIHGEAYQKQAPRGMPDWIPTRQFVTHPRGGGSRLVDFPLLNLREAVQWMVQMNCVDMNAWYSRVDKPTRPDFVLFDLDPPDGAFRLGVKAAQSSSEASEEFELRSYVKTSVSRGSTCLRAAHAAVQLAETHRFAELVSKRVGRGEPRRRHDGVAQARGSASSSTTTRTAREDDRVRVLGSAEGGCARLHPAPLGGADAAA